MLLDAGLTILIVLVIFYLSLCKAAGKDNFKDEYRDRWIDQRKKEESEGGLE